MKRLIFLILGISINFVIFSQGSYDVRIARGNDYGYFTGAASDTIHGAVTADAIFYLQGERGKYLLSYKIDIDTLSGGGGNSVTIQPQGSYDGTTYTNIGSAITWAASQDTAFNANVHSTYSIAHSGTIASHTEIHSGSSSNGSYTGITDTTGLTNYPADTITYSAQTVTYTDTVTVAAQTLTDTETITMPGVDYRYIKILLTGGGASARCELQIVAIKVTPIEIID